MKLLPDFFGIIRTPEAYGISAGIIEGRPWAADNAAFTKGFNEIKFYRFLDALRPYASTCLFVVAPDVVGDAKSTLHLYEQHYDKLRGYPFPVAFVAQDGQESQILPDHDVLFVGGSTEWKMSRYAVEVCKRSGKPIHFGRVNTASRLRYAKSLGARSVDGSCIAFGRDINMRRLTTWMNNLHRQRTIWPPVCAGGYPSLSESACGKSNEAL